MRKLLLVLIFVFGPAMVHAQTWNLDLFLGTGMADTLRWDGVGQETDNGHIAGVAISKTGGFTQNMDLGIEVARAKATYSNARPNNISGTSIMLTAKHSFLSSNNFNVYAGAGLGFVDVKYDNQIENYTNSEIEFAGQLTLGTRYQLAPNVGVFLEGRYIRSKDAHIAYNPATKDVDFRSKAIVFGLRKKF
jgi:opacity protein-like surface antigen